MKRDELRELFLQQIENAVRRIEDEYEVQIPRRFEYSFYGFGYSGEVLELEEVMDNIYLGEDLYIYLVDLAVIKATSRITTVYVAVSGHPPQSKFEDTWNTPAGNGPFKQIVSLQFQQVEKS